jgi:hypothetical protein
MVTMAQPSDSNSTPLLSSSAASEPRLNAIAQAVRTAISNTADAIFNAAYAIWQILRTAILNAFYAILHCFDTFIRWFNNLYFAQSIGGFIYQNGLSFDYSWIGLAIYLPIVIAWMAFAAIAARWQSKAEQRNPDSPQRYNPVILMRCFIVLESIIRGLKNTNWVLTLVAEAATAHGAHLGMVGATGLTQCAGLSLSLLTPIGIAALVGGLLVGVMDAWHRHKKAKRTAAGKTMDALNKNLDDKARGVLDKTHFDDYVATCSKDKPATFNGFLKQQGVCPDIGESNVTSVAALASGLIHGAYRAANVLFIVKLISVGAASSLLGPAAGIFLGLFAAYAIGNALYSLFKEGREQAHLHSKRTQLYDKLFPGARQLFEEQARLQQRLDNIKRQIDKLSKRDGDTKTLIAEQKKVDTELRRINDALKIQKNEYKAKGIQLDEPPKPPKTFAYHFYRFCSNNRITKFINQVFAAVETTINTLKNGCKLGAFIAGLGLTLYAFNKPAAKLAGIVTMGVGLAIGAVGLLCGLLSAKRQYHADAKVQKETRRKKSDTTTVAPPVKTALCRQLSGPGLGPDSKPEPPPSPGKAQSKPQAISPKKDIDLALSLLSPADSGFGSEPGTAASSVMPSSTEGDMTITAAERKKLGKRTSAPAPSEPQDNSYYPTNAVALLTAYQSESAGPGCYR